MGSKPLNPDAIRAYWNEMHRYDMVTAVEARKAVCRCLTVIEALREALATSPTTAEHDAGCRQPAHGGPCRCDPWASPRRWAAKRAAALALVRGGDDARQKEQHKAGPSSTETP